MTVSVIVPTYNGSRKIVTLLRALQQQSWQNYQLIIVIDGSNDDTLEIVSSYRNCFQDPIFFTQVNQGRSVAKNQGASLASGQILIFYDDDMEPSSTSVEGHVKFHQAHTGLLSGNPIEPPHPSKPDIQNYKAYLSERWTSKYNDGITRLGLSNLFFSAANCSMQAHTFHRLGGFDSRISDAEDFDLAARALANGIDVYFDKGNHAVHHDHITCVSYIKRLRQYGTAHRKLRQLHPAQASNQPVPAHSLKKVVYRIFASRQWPALIDRNFFVSWLPKPIRFRLYSMIIQSLAVENPHVPLQ